MMTEDFDFWILAWMSGWKGVLVREEEGRGSSWWGNWGSRHVHFRPGSEG